MTYSLMLQGGDLVAQGSQLAIVSDVNKLQQDTELWLLVRIGSNQMHPGFGSYLESYIGGVIDVNTQAKVYNEILRTLNNYQTLQWQALRTDPAIFSLGELMYSVDSVNVSISYDTVNATVQVSNPVSTATVTISPSSL
jgi:hypothetical protein